MKNKKTILSFISLFSAAETFSSDSIENNSTDLSFNFSQETTFPETIHYTSVRSSKRSSTQSSSRSTPTLSNTTSSSSLAASPQTPSPEEFKKLFNELTQELQKKINLMEENHIPVHDITLPFNNNVQLLRAINKQQKTLGVFTALGVPTTLPFFLKSITNFRSQVENLPSFVEFKSFHSFEVLHSIMPYLLVGGLMAFGHHLWNSNTKATNLILENLQNESNTALASIVRTQQQIIELKQYNDDIKYKLQMTDKSLTTIQDLAKKISESSLGTAQLSEIADFLLQRQQELYKRQNTELTALHEVITLLKSQELNHVFQKLSNDQKTTLTHVEQLKPLNESLEQTSQPEIPKSSKGALHWFLKRIGYTSNNEVQKHSTLL